MKEEGTHPSSFYEVTVSSQTNQYKKENYRTKSFMYRDTKIIYKLLAKRIKQYIKIFIYYDSNSKNISKEEREKSLSPISIFVDIIIIKTMCY